MTYYIRVQATKELLIFSVGWDIQLIVVALSKYWQLTLEKVGGSQSLVSAISVQLVSNLGNSTSVYLHIFTYILLTYLQTELVYNSNCYILDTSDSTVSVLFSVLL